MKYMVNGLMRIKGIWKPFAKEMEANSESRVRECVLTRLGSDHRLRRTQVKIERVEAMKP